MDRRSFLKTMAAVVGAVVVPSGAVIKAAGGTWAFHNPDAEPVTHDAFIPGQIGTSWIGEDNAPRPVQVLTHVPGVLVSRSSADFEHISAVAAKYETSFFSRRTPDGRDMYTVSYQQQEDPLRTWSRTVGMACAEQLDDEMMGLFERYG